MLMTRRWCTEIRCCWVLVARGGKKWWTMAWKRIIMRSRWALWWWWRCKDLQKLGEYKHYAAILWHLKNKSKTEYYNIQFAKYKDNLKQTWKRIGTLVKRKTKGQTFPTRITHNNRTFTQEKDIAELFNNFFENIGPTLAKEIKTAPVTQTQVFTLF